VSPHAVVLIEDDPGDRLLVAEMLVDVAPDVELTSFPSLKTALGSWPTGADCVLLDLGLPDAMGLSALEELRAQVPDVPVVVLTGRIDDGIGPQALAAGAQDFLVKGQVDGRGLERSVRYAIERGRAMVYERDLVAAELRAQENTRLQRGLLPSPLMDSDAVGIDLFYRPGDDRALLGGDFYDVVQTRSGLHLLIGDVSGHGPDEAALGVALRIAWRSLVLAGLPAASVLRGVEQVLVVERNDDEHFATVAMVTLDPTCTTAEVVLCGHPAPLLARGEEIVDLDVEALPVLTMLGATPIEPTRIELGSEWGLLLYTDGLIEGTLEPGSRRRLGVDALKSILSPMLDAVERRSRVAPVLLAEVERRNAGHLSDDVAILLIGSSRWWR